MKYRSTKTYTEAFPLAYRQHRADSHCNQIHGYALTFHFEFEATSLDARNWVVDFGGLKPFKAQLEEWFDHTLLVAVDDPKRAELLRLGELGLAKITEVEKTGCEGLSSFLLEYLNGDEGNNGWLAEAGFADGGRVRCVKVEVRETRANMAMTCVDDY